VREDTYPRGLTILKGAVPGLARGLGHTAPTYFVGSRDRHLTAIAAPRSPLSTPRSFMQLAASKALLRTEALARRKAVSAEQAAAFAARISDIGSAFADEISAAVVAAYWPVKGEASPLALLVSLAARDIVTALPVIGARDAPLTFRRWRPDEALVKVSFGLEEPAHAPVVVPDVLFVPLVAFDRRGFRLGYGAGYYDRTLALLRGSRRVTTVGLAFAVQEMLDIPHEDHDQKLDYILTDRDWIACRTD
jgi:5-formyltetrahydrofolate cyclo-ligase